MKFYKEDILKDEYKVTMGDRLKAFAWRHKKDITLGLAIGTAIHFRNKHIERTEDYINCMEDYDEVVIDCNKLLHIAQDQKAYIEKQEEKIERYERALKDNVLSKEEPNVYSKQKSDLDHLNMFLKALENHKS